MLPIQLPHLYSYSSSCWMNHLNFRVRVSIINQIWSYLLDFNNFTNWNIYIFHAQPTTILTTIHMMAVDRITTIPALIFRAVWVWAHIWTSADIRSLKCRYVCVCILSFELFVVFGAGLKAPFKCYKRERRCGILELLVSRAPIWVDFKFFLEFNFTNARDHRQCSMCTFLF